MRALLIALGAVAGAASVTSGGDHPAVKIIALLDKLVAQVQHEAGDEAATNAKFVTWCTATQKEKQQSITTLGDELDTATALVESLTEDIAQLDVGISGDTASVLELRQAKADATTARNTANTAYLATKGDLDATVTAVEGAIASLEATDPGSALIQHQVEKAAALVEIFEPSKAGALRALLKGPAFLQANPMTADASVARSAGAERKYDFKSGGVIEILKQLQLKFEDEREDASQAETASLNAWKLLDATMQDQVDAAKTARDTKKDVKSRKGQELSQATSDRDDADYDKRATEYVLKETVSSCESRADEFAERSERRAGEIAAMKQAKEVLSKVTGVRAPADKLDAADVSFSFLQKADAPVQKIVNLLRTAAQREATKFLHKEAAGSQVQDLARLADSIAKLQAAPLGKDMFFEIKSMIESMTNHLLSEQRDEDTHKQWCDKETLKSETMETSHETKRDELQADITLLTTQITTLTQAESDNSDDIKDLVDDIEETTATRSENKAENKATMLDAQQAQTAVAKAIAVLSDFYKGVGGMDKDSWDAGEFVQLRAARRVQDPKELKGKDTSQAARQLLREAPSTSLGSYSGTSGGADVVGLLENVAADFAAMETQARTDETTQSDTFDSWLQAAKESQATLEHDNEMKASRIEAKKAKLAAKSGDLVNTKANLKATVKYLTSLEPACEEGDSTYADKKAARTAEIEALKEAGKILETAFD